MYTDVNIGSCNVITITVCHSFKCRQYNSSMIIYTQQYSNVHVQSDTISHLVTIYLTVLVLVEMQAGLSCYCLYITVTTLKGLQAQCCTTQMYSGGKSTSNKMTWKSAKNPALSSLCNKAWKFINTNYM